MMHIKLGAIKGRHDMPVFDYIFDGEVNPLDLAGIYRQIRRKVSGYTSVDLYVTGLTVVTAAVIHICYQENIGLTLYHYDRESGDYYPQKMERTYGEVSVYS